MARRNKAASARRSNGAQGSHKGQATKKGYFSRSPGRKYQLGSARVVPDMY